MRFYGSHDTSQTIRVNSENINLNTTFRFALPAGVHVCHGITQQLEDHGE
jgi:hypothetical protein